MLWVLIWTGAMNVAATAETQGLAGLLPAEISGYRPEDADELAEAQGLFRLIDGGAEVYLALNVHRVIERRYGKKGGADIVVDVFDMGSGADAFGAYHHDMREGESAGIGQESELQGGNLSFWKGNFFVAVVALRQSSGAKEGVLAIGRAIAGNIQASGQPPDLLGLLPAEGLVKSQVHYFHDWPLLSRLAFLSGDNLLKLGKDTEGLLARYRLGRGETSAAGRPALLVVRYPTAERAKAAGQALQGGMAQLDTPHPIEVRQTGRLLAAVLDAPSASAARQLLESISLAEGAGP